MTRLCLVLLIAMLGRGTSAQEAPSPYRGQEGREIKALSLEEIDALQAGEGMGLARAAELNLYPGPKHVLDLAESLELTEEQRARTGEAFRRMKESAVALGAAIVEEERALDRMFRERVINQEKLETAVRGIANLQGKLRLVHLEAHLELESVLTPEQVSQYTALRGYDDPAQHHQRKKHH